MIVSFSGGKTSAYMAYLVKKSDPKSKFVFMNTGTEHAETYKFIRQCDAAFGLNVIWIETVVQHGQRKSSQYAQVTPETATYGTALFQEVVKKYGLMGPGFLHCTRELKINPFKAWRKANAKGETIAIGIRADEMDRVDPSYKKLNYCYPLLDLGVTKREVEAFWAAQDFTLNLPEHLGNCVGCWKKSAKKLQKVVQDQPQALRDLLEVEALDTSRRMFRGRRTVQDVLENRKANELEDDAGCKESCEPF